jgi:hypothetical protein
METLRKREASAASGECDASFSEAGLEADVEHPICLIEREHFKIRQFHRSILQVVE